MAKKTEQSGFRVVIEPRRLGDFGCVSMSDHLVCNDEEDRLRQYRERCEGILDDVRRHVDNVGHAGIEFDTDHVCEHCRAAIPPGYALVPVEPTPEMIERGRWYEYPESSTPTAFAVDDLSVKQVWENMVKAAPQPAPEPLQATDVMTVYERMRPAAPGPSIL